MVFGFVGAVTLKALVTELEEVIDWFNFGVHLEVRESDLMAIRYTHLNSRDIKASKTDLFTLWLKSSNQLTWSTVVRALVGIRMEPLAKKLAMKYGKRIIIQSLLKYRLTHTNPKHLFISRSVCSTS